MFPPEGITVFGSLLHTHLVGKNPSIFIMIIHDIVYNTQGFFFLCNTLHFTLLCYSILNWTLENISGHGLVLQHFRRNEECGVLEELEPVDINLKYDFNYQV